MKDQEEREKPSGRWDKLRRFYQKIQGGKSTKAGIALVGVLFLIALAAIMLVAFVSTARTDLAATTHYSKSLMVDLLAQDALNQVISETLYEIEQNSVTSSSDSISERAFYTPKEDKDYSPQRDAHALQMARSNILNLLKTSRRGVEFFEGSNVSLASTVSTDDPSLNNRRLSAQAWNTARLLTTAQNQQTLADGYPDWIYVDRNGPVQLDKFSERLLKSVLGDRLNHGYVLGRYAYRVYDTSGLININVVGAPGNLPEDLQAKSKRKGSLAWLDLYNNPLPGYIGESDDPISLFNWKWASDLAKYDDYITNYGQRYGYQVAPPTSEGYVTNRFLDRTDLIYYAYSETARNQFSGGDPEEFLTHVNTFSTAVNSPDWKPVNTPAASPEEIHTSPNDARVTKPFTRRDGTEAQVGELLLKSRFPLTMIALFNEESDLSQSMSQEERLAKIKDYFGLEPEGLKWTYDEEAVVEDSSFSPDEDGLRSRERLLAFQEIAEEGREPNFFEVLQAGIWPDSLGQIAQDENQVLENIFNNNSTFRHLNSFLDTDSIARELSRHIWQIGLNIIDQYDEDSDPTVIARNDITSNPEGPSGSGFAIDHDLAGIENIPYLFALGHHTTIRLDDQIGGVVYDSVTHPSIVGDSDGSATYQLPVNSSATFHWTFNLWNPHRNASQSQGGEYRLKFHGLFKSAEFYDQFIQVKFTPESWSNGAHIRNGAAGAGQGPDSPVTDFINFTVLDGDFADPRFLIRSDASSFSDDANGNDDYYEEDGSNVFGFYKGKFELSNYQVPDNTNFDNHRLYIDAEQYHIQLEKLVKGSWLPVQTITEIGGNYSSYIPRVSKELNHNSNNQQDFSKNGIARLYSFFPDPRVTRFGFLHTGTSEPERDLGLDPTDHVLLKLLDSDSGSDALCAFSGFDNTNEGSYTTWVKTQHFDCKAMSSNKASGEQSYSDRGNSSQIRAADNPNATFNYSDGQIISRPIVLNRPFTSIAEMSYACRDLPWKTLNLLNHEENPDSAQPAADAALLELFSLNEASVRSDKVNLNKAPREVLKAIVANTDVAPIEGEDPGATITENEAEQLVDEIEDYLGPKENPTNILTNSVDIAQMLQSFSSYTNRDLKVQRDALLSALSDIHNARTWHLLIDVITQSGSFTPASRNLKDFHVTGQKHLIVQVAIDRLTGEVIDQVIEQPVEERFY
ncbi:MAG: hypothetical protein AAGA18_07980 [Verrucomicrobiota bacterium]